VVRICLRESGYEEKDLFRLQAIIFQGTFEAAARVQRWTRVEGGSGSFGLAGDFQQGKIKRKRLNFQILITEAHETGTVHLLSAK